MNYYHFTNDISFEISLESVTTGQTLDPSVISVVRLFTRKNGRVYCACYGNNTLINNGNTVSVILNNHGLEPGVLQYEVVMQIPDSIYPDKFKKISQFYVSDIELVKGSGQTDYADVQQMFGTTIDEKFQEINDAVDELNADTQVVKATIVQIQEHDAIQDSSIRNIEDIISGIHGDESASISRLNSSVNNLETDVNNLNTSVGNLNNLVDRLDADLAGISNDLENKADVSVLGSYALKTDLNNYPTNSSVSSTYATKAQIQGCIDENDLTEVLADYPTNSSVSDNYVHWLYANENYVSYENIDEIVFNIVDNNYDVHWKINEIVNDSSSFADISTNVKDISTLVTNVSTKLDRDYLTAQTINTDFVKNASLNTTLGSYVTKTQMNSSLLTKQDSLPFSDESDEIMDNDNLGIAGLAMNSVNGVDEYGILVTDGFEKDEQTGAYLGLENPITGNAAADLIQDYCEDFVQTTDISTFKPIVFCTQEEYDTLVENDQVDANTVYMLSGDQTGGEYLTPNDVSIYALTSYVDTIDSSIVNYVDTQIGNIQNILQTI